MSQTAPLRRIVIVGASLAGLNAAETLRLEGCDAQITLIGDEPHLPYDRPPLSKQLLTGEWDIDRLPLRTDAELAALNLEFRSGQTAAGLDIATRNVILDHGERVSFDALIIATGATPNRLPASVAGADLDGVHLLRTQADALRIRNEYERGGRIVVIGAGFIGAEAASSARARGLDVTMVEALAAPMLGPLGDQIAGFAARLHADNGVDLRINALATEIVGRDRVEAVRVQHGDDGETIEASAVIVGTGVRPATDWLAGSGLSIGDGVICDQYCRAGGADDALIYAAGDVARWPNGLFGPFAYAEPQRTMRIEHWTNAIEQGEAAARNLLAQSRGEPPQPFAPVPYFWSDQHGLTIMAAGLTNPRDQVVIAHGSMEAGRFAALYGLRGYLSGVVAVGWPRMLRRYQSLIRDRTTWEDALASALE